jgi:hypothetical protein
MKNKNKRITIDDVEYWLGTDDQLAEAIETLVDIANGEYDPDTLKEDIIETVDQKDD